MAKLRERKKIKATERKFTLRMQKKLVVLFFLVLSAFVGLSIKLFYIGKDNGKEYEKQVLSQQQYDSTTPCRYLFQYKTVLC